MSHIRKITRESAAAIRDAKSAENGGQELSDYAAGALFSAVRVGETPTYLYYHVNLADSPSLPGESLGQYGDLNGNDRKFILECTYSEYDEELETEVIHRVKLNKLPEDATAIDTDLIPHRFA